jgi:hypothetical protein
MESSRLYKRNPNLLITIPTFNRAKANPLVNKYVQTNQNERECDHLVR